MEAETKAPNEKLVELLFTSNALRLFPLGAVAVYAPSSHEEFVRGYDASFVGKDTCRELYLQFKRPRLRNRLHKKGFTISLKTHQHEHLKNYPRNTAYYVSPAFCEISEIQQAQSNASTPNDFLKHFIAVEISTLPDSASAIRFKREREDALSIPQEACYKIRSKHSYEDQDPQWMLGSELLTRFKAKEVGGMVEFKNAFNDKNRPLRIRPVTTADDLVAVETSALQLLNPITPFIDEEIEGGLGIMLRVY